MKFKKDDNVRVIANNTEFDDYTGCEGRVVAVDTSLPGQLPYLVALSVGENNYFREDELELTEPVDQTSSATLPSGGLRPTSEGHAACD